MISLPLERLLAIATCQARPGVVVVTDQATPGPAIASTEPVDTGLAARMVANGLRLLLHLDCWQRRPRGPGGLVGETGDLRLLLWMDSRDDQPGMVALWDMAQPVPTGCTAYGDLLPRPVLVIGRALHSGDHFITRYAPGPWLDRLLRLAREPANPDQVPPSGRP